MSTKRIAVGALLALPLLGAALLPIGGAARAQEFYGSDNWIAFVARVTQYDERGSVVLTGRVCRASDGSYRWEGHARKTSHTVVIHNLRNHRAYKLGPGTSEWIEQPLGIPDGPHRPLRIRVNSTQFAAATIDHPEFPDVVVSQKPGQRAYMAPELNLFPIRIEFSSGVREETSNIQLREPDASEFMPPPGASVKYDPRPGGIIRTERSKHGNPKPIH